jgi:hypothetical protein
MNDFLTGWFLFFEWVICVPLSFLFCGPVFRHIKGRIALISWFWCINAAIIAVFYFTTPDFQFAILLVTAIALVTSVLGLLAAKFGWHLGPRTRRLFESIVGFWIRVLEWFVKI